MKHSSLPKGQRALTPENVSHAQGSSRSRRIVKEVLHDEVFCNVQDLWQSLAQILLPRTAGALKYSPQRPASIATFIFFGLHSWRQVSFVTVTAVLMFSHPCDKLKRPSSSRRQNQK
ncbi:unnamed protein product, partial [Scytosiphon promiscuus]